MIICHIFIDIMITENITPMKRRTTSGILMLSAISFLLIISSCSQKQNWPQFRGPDANMISSVSALPEEWDTVKNIAWTYKLDGAGWSSPVVWGNKVFITSSFPEKVAPAPERNQLQGPPPPSRPAGVQQGMPPRDGRQPQPGQGQQGPPPQEDTDTTFKQDIYRWEITCLDLNTGEQLWKQTAFRGNPRVKKHQMNNYATETPVTDGERVFAYFGNRGLYCYDLDGNLLWSKDLGAFKVLNGWGTGSSPVIFNGIIYIQADNEENSFLVALDAATGNEKWRVIREEKTNYSTPYVWKNKLRTEIVANGKKARSYDAETGKLLWELNAGGEQTIPSPAGDESTLYLGNASGQNVKGSLFAVKAGAEGDITPSDGASSGNGILWVLPDAGLGNGSPLVYNGLIYVIASRGGEIKCINAQTGSLVYRERVSGTGAVWASPWIYTEKVWFLDDKGVTRSFTAGNTFKLVSENRLKDSFWASVAITDGGYIFRGVKAVYCVRE